MNQIFSALSTCDVVVYNSMVLFYFQEIDNEDFIAAVKEHPVIWNCSREDYNDRSKKKQTWLTVSHAWLINDWRSKFVQCALNMRPKYLDAAVKSRTCVLALRPR